MADLKRSLVRCMLLTASFAGASHASTAQDTLFYNNGSYITGTVEEVGVDIVRYHTGADGTVKVTADKKDFQRIKLHSGQEFVFRTPESLSASPEFLARKQCVSIDFLAPALGHATIGYEHAIGKNMSIGAKVGYIGLGNYARINDRYNYQGGLIKLGVKFILPPNRRRVPNARDEHPLAGWYLKPELMASAWTSENYYAHYYDPYFSWPNVRHDYSSVAFNMVVGRQVIIGQRFTFDAYGGLGYGAQWVDGKQTGYGYEYYSSDRQEYSFSHTFLGNYTPLTLSGGMTFGVLF